MLPERTIDLDTGQLVANTTVDELLINSLQAQNSFDVPKLGRPFLSAAYLMVNHDEGTFTLWSASMSSEEDLVSVGKCDTDSNDAGVTETKNSGGQGQVGRGTIAGAAVGAVVGVAIVIGLVGWMLWRKKHRKAVNARTGSAMTNDDKKEALSAPGPYEADGRETYAPKRTDGEPPSYVSTEQALPGLHELPSRRETME